MKIHRKQNKVLIIGYKGANKYLTINCSWHDPEDSC